LEKTFENITRLVERHNQGHLLAFWEHLDAAQRRDLLAQIEQLDFSQMADWVSNCVKKPPSVVVPGDFSPAWCYSLEPPDGDMARKYTEARHLGEELISAGKVAGFVVAGGQGTRLGFDGPKGGFPISSVKNKTLFRIFAEMVAAVSKRYQTHCPWYIMTSPLNHAETQEVFRSNDYYGMDESDVFIFQQGTLPNFSFDGKILLADKGRISCSPDGHGGSLKALYKSGAIADMKKRGVEFISYWLERLNSEGFALRLHRAVKKIPYIDAEGKRVEPAEPNGVKLESFVFDALPLASRSIILETERSQEFAPVKNRTGIDSAESAREMMVSRAAAWLESAGVAVPRKQDGSVDCLIEIAPSFALEGDDVKAKVDQIPKIKPGDKLYLG